MASILVTGASGFIGSFVVEEALEKGFITWAGIRRNSSREYLKDNKINFFVADLENEEELREQLKQYKEKFGAFDYIVHCAGITKSIDKQKFEKINFFDTKMFVNILLELNMKPKMFIYISSLSVFGAIHEQNYLPISDMDERLPNTAYGISKLHSETFFQSLLDFPYVLLRPTGVYGPRERDYYLMAKSIKNHLDFSVGFRHQDLTFIYVKDLVKVIFLCIEKKALRRAYFVSDNNVYTSRTFSSLIRKELGNPFVIHIKSSLIFLKVISLCAEFVSKIIHRPSTLNSDKYKIMKQRNWRCDISLTQKELGYVPDYDLEKGVKETIAWYKKVKWL